MDKIIILGAGIQGEIVATDLCDKELSPTKKEIIICDYNYEKVKIVAEKLHICGIKLDVTENEELKEKIRGAKVVINCVQYTWNIMVMKACLAEGVNYIDLGGLFHVTKEQLELHDKFVTAGLTAVLGMGSTPGTMNVMAGYAASKLDTIDSADAICACGDFTRTEAVIGIPYSLITIMEEHTMDPWILKDGKLQSVQSGSGRELIHFTEPIGVAEAQYCIHSEPILFARSFKDKGIRNACFKLSLPAAFEERIRFLADVGFGTEEEVIVGGSSINPLKTIIEVINKYLENYDDSRDGELNDCDILRTVVKGTKDGIEKEIIVESVIRTSKKWGFMAGALDTGIPPSIVAQMICSGEVKKAGVYSGEQCVPFIPYFRELAKREMPVYCIEKTPLSHDTFDELHENMYREK